MKDNATASLGISFLDGIIFVGNFTKIEELSDLLQLLADLGRVDASFNEVLPIPLNFLETLLCLYFHS